VGYCVCSITREKVGEIESIFVEAEYRSRGIGTGLMKQALEWMDRSGAEKKRVFVADGNEQAYGFYRRFGFSPRMMMLEQRSE
jgi:ribosomal protein S18 acetylase RimI-like enzyme